MESKEIIERVINLVDPRFKNIVSKLDVSETEYFIYHLTKDVEKSLSHWEFKNSTWKIKQ